MSLDDDRSPGEFRVGIKAGEINDLAPDANWEVVKNHKSVATKFFAEVMDLLNVTNVTVWHFNDLGNFSTCDRDNMLGCIAQSKIDIDLQPKIVNYERFQHFNFSYPFIYSPYRIAVRATRGAMTPDDYSTIVANQKIMQTQSYLYVCLFAFLSLLLWLFWRFFVQKKPYARISRKAYDQLMQCLKALIMFICVENYQSRMDVVQQWNKAPPAHIPMITSSVKSGEMKWAVLNHSRKGIEHLFENTYNKDLQDLYKEVKINQPEGPVIFNSYRHLCHSLVCGTHNYFVIILEVNLKDNCPAFMKLIRQLALDEKLIMAGFAFPKHNMNTTWIDRLNEGATTAVLHVESDYLSNRNPASHTAIGSAMRECKKADVRRQDKAKATGQYYDVTIMYIIGAAVAVASFITAWILHIREQLAITRKQSLNPTVHRVLTMWHSGVMPPAEKQRPVEVMRAALRWKGATVKKKPSINPSIQVSPRPPIHALFPIGSRENEQQDSAPIGNLTTFRWIGGESHL